ncbi:aminoglycoside 3'-phosphotransferase [Paenibacillus flagellatus]|uniref:Aminoglycoside 3'-phosphotransferase n=1 Tax=Paenibacillus flagellatus TaxID=2211139 RepID=A0A2V5JWE1_9BACL|nr:aminoglycoside 3'-phosphotransferase [Paenibacillus flagellatus]PYI51008.1 aminoglycoside 3'-phosphotransferase [Paenibacillus flagellatus]
MDRTKVSLDREAVPLLIRPYLKGAVISDSSCSDTARTYRIEGDVSAFLKISRKGALERECGMTAFLHGHRLAPAVIAYESDAESDYLLTEAVSGEDGTARSHLDHPRRLAGAFGEYLRMLHSLPTDGCPYRDRTAEMVREAAEKEANLGALKEIRYAAADDTVIHGDYCLPNIVMDRFSFKGFIDVGSGGVGDRHCDLYWGLWTLAFNLKTDAYNGLFLDAYGRSAVDADGLAYFAKLAELTD